MKSNYFYRFARAFGSHFSHRLRGKTTWDAAQITLANALVEKLWYDCKPFDTVIPDKELRRLVFDGFQSGDINTIKNTFTYCKIISPKPECCDVYLDAISSLTECHPPYIKRALVDILDEQSKYDQYMDFLDFNENLV